MHIQFIDETNPGASWYRYRVTDFSDFKDDVGGGGIGRAYDNVLSGRIGSFSIADGPNTFSDVTTVPARWPGVVGAVFIGTQGYIRDKYGLYNPGCYFDRLTISEESAQFRPEITTGALIEIGEVLEVVMTDLVVEGGAPVHDLIHFFEQPVNAPSITVNLINPTIPSGYVVRMAPGYEENESFYTFQVDGVAQTLPWTAP
jgi:hypothetical protein